MTEWPEYESHKVVRAAKIVSVVRNSEGNLPCILVQPDPDGGPREEFAPTVQAMAEKAEIGGYAVLYPDGYRSISPASAFEEGYTRK